MNAEITKRIVRAIAEGSQLDLDKLALKVVEAERKSGHHLLAKQLESILVQAKEKQSRGRTRKPDRLESLRSLPQSKRFGDQLATLIPRDELEHHMVLPPETEARFARIESEYAARERLGAYGLKARKTILLYGAPGCGKSLGANRIAWNTGLPLMKVRIDALISSYFGESASNLRSVFDASQDRPCVLLLDECDFIARSRSNSKDIGEASRIVNSLLQLMEDYNAPGILVATTNVESSLDEALFRRFDDAFQVPLPGSIEIEKLLKTTLSAVTTDSSINWHDIISKLAGNSAAMVVKTARDAAKSVVLTGQKIVTEKHLQSAILENSKLEPRK
tara:strand:- start:34593 stop:35594 length:1002 start_codon:yes stop_codon:yes gene_type:complete